MRIVVAIATVTLLFEQVSRPTSPLQGRENASSLVSIRMIDAQTGWATTAEDGILRTLNGGTQWTDVTPQDNSGQKVRVIPFRWAYHGLNSVIAWAIRAPDSGATPSQVFLSVDGGKTWREGTVGAIAESIHAINAREAWVLSTLAVFMGSKHFVEIYRTIDGGETWNKVATTSSKDDGSGGPSGLTLVAPRTIFTS